MYSAKIFLLLVAGCCFLENHVNCEPDINTNMKFKRDVEEVDVEAVPLDLVVAGERLRRSPQSQGRRGIGPGVPRPNLGNIGGRRFRRDVEALDDGVVPVDQQVTGERVRRSPQRGIGPGAPRPNLGNIRGRRFRRDVEELNDQEVTGDRLRRSPQRTMQFGGVTYPGGLTKVGGGFAPATISPIPPAFHARF